MGRTRDDRFDIVDEFVADETDRAAGESGKARKGNRSIPLHHRFNHLESVADLAGVSGRIGGSDGERLQDFSIFDHLDAGPGLANDGAGIAADERVTADVFAALDGLEEERFALAADFAIGRERSFEVGENGSGDGDEISRGGGVGNGLV